jgi:hypothetical protein
MVKLTNNIKSKKQKIAQRQRKTKAVRKRNNILHGGAGSIVLQWCDQPEFIKVNAENDKMLQLNLLHTHDKYQHNVYYTELTNLLEYKKYEVNMDFISNFYKHIYYDISQKYAIDLRNKSQSWLTPTENILYDITSSYVNPTHQNTTIVFLKSKSTSTEKVIKIFTNIDCDINKIREFLPLEISHISKKSRNIIAQFNYLHYVNLDTFNKFNFNQKKNYIHEVSEDKSKIYLSCRNADPVNEYIINLIIGFINKNLDSPIKYVHYDNLFVTTVYNDKYPNGKQCWCLLMDKVDGSIDSIIKKNKNNILPNETILDYLQQAEALLKPLKTADYLFTHTDMKLENLFYKKNGSGNSAKIELYLADLDKSSITFKGIRFYNDLNESPSVKIAGISFDPVQGYAVALKGDDYINKSYPLRKVASTNNETYEYRLSRIGRVNSPGDIEFEAFYMRYNNQPFYTSFDIISLWLSILHFRRDKGAIIDFEGIKSSEILANFLTKYMTKDTINLLTDFYSGLELNYGGNFGLLLKPIFDREQSQLNHLKFLQHYDSTEPKLIKGLYLTLNNKLALSLPFVPTSITVKDKITSFKPNKAATESHELYKSNTNSYITEFIKALDEKNILTITYSGDYSVDAEKGSKLALLFHSKPPSYIVKTNRYSTIGYYYEWDYMLRDIDLPKVIKLFENLSTGTYNEGRRSTISVSLTANNNSIPA